jgi:hypothetical protein
MTPREFRQAKNLEFDHFIELTNTGIKPRYVNIELFAQEYHKAKLNLLTIPNVVSKMTKKNDTSENKAQCAIQNVSNNTDFWKDAQEFLNSQLPVNFKEKMKEYCESKEYKQNDFRLFKSMLQEAVGFKAMMILLKHYY